MVAAVAEAVAALQIPGAAIGVLDHGEATTFSFGVTNLDDPIVPVDTGTIFQIGSISKTFVGTLAMVLLDQDRLDLDEPIRSYLSDLRLSTEELTEAVTLRHLLTHSVGWVGDYFGDTGDGDDALARFVVKLAKAPQLTPLGETYSYNNTAFNLAAHVLATIAGAGFERAVTDLVLTPLGMRRTFYFERDAIVRRVAVGHRDGRPQPWRKTRAHNGGGGVLSCVDDMLRYAAFHLGHGSPLMSRATLELMHATARPAGSLCDEVALPWMVDHIAGVRVVHHGGTTNGYQADLRLVRERDLAWVMLTNSDHHHQLDRVIINHLLGDDIVPAGEQPPFDSLAGFAGHYEAVLAEVDVSVEDGGLVLSVGTPATAVWNRGEPPPPPDLTRAVFRDADRIVCLDQPFRGHRGEFLRGPDGTVEWLRWDGRIARRTPDPAT